MKRAIVLVHWIDSSELHGWRPDTDVDDMRKRDLDCHTAGFLIHDDAKRVVVALNVNEGQVGSVISIPRMAVKKMTVLRTAKQ